MTTTEPDVKSGDPHQLLPGENRATYLADDAEHWIRVYSEFIRFKRDLLAEFDKAGSKLTDDVRTAASVTDVAKLRAQYERLLERLTFWENRLVELRAAES